MRGSGTEFPRNHNADGERVSAREISIGVMLFREKFGLGECLRRRRKKETKRKMKEKKRRKEGIDGKKEKAQRKKEKTRV